MEGGTLDVGEPICVPLPDLPGAGESESEPEATLTASWSRIWVTPRHNVNWPPNAAPDDDLPHDCRATMFVSTRHVPDGTSAQIEVRHCASGATVPEGTISGLEVQDNFVLDPETGTYPVFVFTAEQEPWDPWDSPFYYFHVTVDHQGLEGETPSAPGAGLRVMYWDASVSDAIADTPAGGNLTTGDEMTEIAGILRTSTHRVYVRAFNQANVPVALWGSVLRNTYAYHHASHGDVVDRTTGAQLNAPGNPPTVAVGNWRSVVVLGSTDLGDAEVNQTGNVPSVPRYLVYMDTCVAGWEPSLGQAFIDRGTQNYLAFRKYIPDGAARGMARRFYRRWKSYDFDPAKISDIFWEVGALYYDDMRPILMGQGGGQIAAQRSAGLWEAIRGAWWDFLSLF